jgi:hypothetical protein
MQTATGDATPVAQPDPWFRTRSPEQAIYLCKIRRGRIGRRLSEPTNSR